MSGEQSRHSCVYKGQKHRTKHDSSERKPEKPEFKREEGEGKEAAHMASCLFYPIPDTQYPLRMAHQLSSN
jgi:hypothetical protein